MNPETWGNTVLQDNQPFTDLAERPGTDRGLTVLTRGQSYHHLIWAA